MDDYNKGLPELSEATIKKFAEINKKIDSAEEVLVKQVEKEKEDQFFSTKQIREKDEGLNEDGTIKEEDQDADELQKSGDESKEQDELVKGEKKEDLKEDKTKLSLPHRLVQAAYRNHLTNEDIKNLGDRAETVLTSMADNLDKISTELGELGRLRKGMLQKPELKSEKQKDEISDLDDADPIMKLINQKFNALENKLAAITQSAAITRATEMDLQIDKFFDEKSKQFSQLGSSDNLSPFELGLRKQIFDIADDIVIGAQEKGKPVTLNEALKMSFGLYEKDSIKKQVREDILNQVKQREAQLTHRPTQRKTQQIYKEPIKKAQDTVQDFWRKKGINIELESI